ncbi:MAG: hypothetical protein BZ151_10180 [Desulfobacca sp. 4484_104]|nr:MAG: hypothetical protein BZ151_10180 [Desulfobacca sp. 4484_104]
MTAKYKHWQASKPVEFSWDDVQRWLNCDEQAGRYIWLEANFAIEKSRFAVMTVRNRISCYWSYSFDELLDIALTVTMDEFYPWIKQNKNCAFFEKKGGLSGFMAYVNKTLPYRLIDKLRRSLSPCQVIRPEPLGEAGDGGGEYEIPDSSPGPEEILITGETKESFCECRSLADELWGAFKAQLPHRAKALKKRIALLENRQTQVGILEVILYLKKNWQHIQFLRFARQELGNEFIEAIWSSYNRRLKIKWEEFIDSFSDQSKVQTFEECLESVYTSIFEKR